MSFNPVMITAIGPLQSFYRGRHHEFRPINLQVTIANRYPAANDCDSCFEDTGVPVTFRLLQLANVSWCSGTMVTLAFCGASLRQTLRHCRTSRDACRRRPNR